MALLLPQAPSTRYSNLRALSTSKFHTYQAFDNQLSHLVVLKVFPALESVNPKYNNEKAILSNLQHQNIIQLIDTNDMAITPTNQTDDLTSYLVLEHAMHGDLLDVVQNNGRMPEELARTVFRQLIDAISYMHSQNIAHLDIKMENLLLSSDYTIKLADFDLSQNIDSKKLEAKGTPNSRAPEVRKGECQDFKAADLYSAGIVLFSLVSGLAPYSETESSFGPGYDRLHKLFKNNNQKFWDFHARYVGNNAIFGEDFKKLVNWLLSEDPRERPTIEELKSSSWYQGTVLGEEEYQNQMKKYMKRLGEIAAGLCM